MQGLFNMVVSAIRREGREAARLLAARERLQVFVVSQLRVTRRSLLQAGATDTGLGRGWPGRTWFARAPGSWPSSDTLPWRSPTAA
jgi:hypothetical protein